MGKLGVSTIGREQYSSHIERKEPKGGATSLASGDSRTPIQIFFKWISLSNH